MTQKYKSKERCSLFIELLPEFGWTVHGKPVYGPGSVFQGIVKIRSSKPLQAERLRLLFHASEQVSPFVVTPGIIRAQQMQLFGVQHTLWTNKTGQPSLTSTSHSFPFTIQLPMVQFPPSVVHELYRCTFTLTAVLDNLSAKGDICSIRTQKQVQYMPFVETALLKLPVSTEGRLQQRGIGMKARATVHALHYVPGDTVRVSIHISGKSATHVSVKLMQTLSILQFADISNLSKAISSVSEKLKPSTEDIATTVTLDLPLPQNLTPSLDYSTAASISYQLYILVQRKGPLGGIWSSDICMKLPITIGTLGYGIRVSDELQLYKATTIESIPAQPLSCSPKFMRIPEYEDALPRYESDPLPPAYSKLVSTCSVAATAVTTQPLTSNPTIL